MLESATQAALIPREILDSLLQIGITEYNAPIYVLAKFSLTYILNPVKSVREFIVDLEKEAKTNSFIKEVLSYKFNFEGSFMPVLEFLSNSGLTQVFADLQYVYFVEERMVFKFFFRELVSIYYYPKLDLLSYFMYFKVDILLQKFPPGSLGRKTR